MITRRAARARGIRLARRQRARAAATARRSSTTSASTSADAPPSDRIEDAVDYRDVADCVQSSPTGAFHLLEALASAVADALLERFEVERVRVRVASRLPPGSVRSTPRLPSSACLDDRDGDPVADAGDRPRDVPAGADVRRDVVVRALAELVPDAKPLALPPRSFREATPSRPSATPDSSTLAVLGPQSASSTSPPGGWSATTALRFPGTQIR